MALILRGKFYHYRFMAGARRYCGSTKQTHKGRAETFERNLIARILEGDGPAPGKSPRLSDFSVTYLAHTVKRVASGSLKPRTHECYQYGVKLLSGTPIWRMRLDQVNRPAAEELTFRGGPATANQALRTLRAMLGYAEQLGILRAVPTIDLREEEGRIRIFAPWEEEMFLRHASPVLRDILTIMFDCGMRPDEVCRMKWEDIRWQEGTILVQRGKSIRARRHVGLTERMRETLAGTKRRNEKWKRAESPYVFPSPRNANGHAENLSQVWARTYDRVERELRPKRIKLAPGLVPYCARHTYATHYLRGGGDVGQLSRLMGHSDIRTTMRYVHLVDAGESAKVMDRHNERKLQIVRKQA